MSSERIEATSSSGSVARKDSTASVGSLGSVDSVGSSGNGKKEKEQDQEQQEETLEDEPKNILIGMIRQLKYGMDLHRITFPTFVLEPRSMLERITDFVSYPALVFQAEKLTDPTNRFLKVLAYFLAGWHIRPKGVKKPYNPVLGEFFRCRWELEDGTESFYIAEQVSHHPPVSAYYYANLQHGVVAEGFLAPKSRFLGNSAASLMEGYSILKLINHPGEEYRITMPNIYARGILFGTMVFEICDTCKIICEANDLVCDLDFKAKGYFTGTYNAVAGSILKGNKALYKISGKWSDTVYYAALKDTQKKVLLNVEDLSLTPKIVASDEEQEEYESRRLWNKVTKALQVRDFNAATEEKTKIEENQRALRGKREEESCEFVPRFFVRSKTDPDRWHCRGNVFTRNTPEDREALRKFIFESTPPSSATTATSQSADSPMAAGSSASLASGDSESVENAARKLSIK